MVIYTKLVNSTTPTNVLTDANTMTIILTTNDNNTAGTFNLSIPNEYGRHKNDFNIGDEIKVFIDKDIDPPTTLRFTGRIDSVDFQDKNSPVNNVITINGRDYSAMLQNVTIPPTVFNNLDAGSIVRYLVNTYCSGLSTGSVADTGYIVKHISFNHTPVYDGIVQMAGYTDYQFFVDQTKNVNFQPKGVIVNNFSLGPGSNVTTAKFRNNNNKMYNQIWVYGDRVLTAAPVITQKSDGIGSVISLQYKPSSTQVTSSGTTIVKGGIFNLNNTSTSGIQYLVDYDNSKIVWTSGTTIGNNIPASGTISTVTYDRSIPVAKYIEDSNSINLYGPSAKIIQDKNIKDPRQATDVAKSNLSEFAYPRQQGTIKLQGVAPILPGTRVPVYLPFHNVSGLYNIFQIQYDISPSNNFRDEVMTISVGEKIPDLTDTLKQTILDIKRIQAGDISATDVITRIQTSTGSTGMKVSSWIARTATIGSDWYVGSPFANLPVNSYVGSPGSYWIGSHAKTWTIQASGGEY